MFGRKKKTEIKSYDHEKEEPVIKCSICFGEQVAGFRNRETGHFSEVMLIRTPAELEQFKETYGISGDIEKIY